MFACSDDGDSDSNEPCPSQPILETNPVQDIGGAGTDTSSATFTGEIINIPFGVNCDYIQITNQGFVYATQTQPTIDDIVHNVTGQNISFAVSGLSFETVYYVRTYLTNELGTFYGNEVSFTTPTYQNPVYLDDNGITVRAKDWAEVGMSGEIDGLTYTIVSKNMLMGMIANNQDLSKVCTSKITDLSNPNWGPHQSLFGSSDSFQYEFNQDISSWDVSNVTNMGGMFANEQVFNQDISSWDVSNVTTMEYMFSGLYSSTSDFNQNLSDWDVSNVTNMRWMFGYSSFNQPIGSWDVSNVTNMELMFKSSRFNQDIGSWDVSNVTNMASMFHMNLVFNKPIGNWDVSNVTTMRFMFTGLLGANLSDGSQIISPTVFNQPIGSWDVSSVTDMSYMFSANSDFNQDISNWDVSGVIDSQGMGHMFYSAESFNQDISNWDVSNVTNMNRMFNNAELFNQPIGSWDVSNVTNMEYMFAFTDYFNQDISNWDVSNVTNMRGMFFSGGHNYDSGNPPPQNFYSPSVFNQDLSIWNVGNVVSCDYFCENSSFWTLPKPNFTNCSDDNGCN